MTIHKHPTPVTSKLKISVLLTFVIFVAELVGGIVSNSLALLSDAGHVFVDLIALSLSWYGVRQARRPASHKMTFGYHRIGVIIAIINAISIFAIAGFIFYEAFHRFQSPAEVNSLMMSIVAAVGLIVNLFVVYWLRKEQKENLNIRSAFWHAAGDALASIGVIVGGIIILITGIVEVDTIISVLIGLIIISAAWSIFKEGFRVLIEAAPSNLDIHGLITKLNKSYGVKEIHDVHIWSISPEINAMSCHILVEEDMLNEIDNIRGQMEKILENCNIHHSVIQIESIHCGDSDKNNCRI
jgi:cobalt-zinc-cadmium efflux system protein